MEPVSHPRDYFEQAVTELLKHEGGYVNHPKDPGGETNFGISKRQYPHLNIKALKVEDAKAIYRVDYWQKFGCDKMPWPLACVFFDCVVNHNPSRPVIWLQRCLGLPVTGRIDSSVIEATQRCYNPLYVATEVMVLRGEYWASLSTYPHFGRGWRARGVRVMSAAARGWMGS